MTKSTFLTSSAFFSMLIACSSPSAPDSGNRNPCFTSDKEAFDAFANNAANKDYTYLQSITTPAPVIPIDYSALFSKYKNLKVEFLPEEADGAYGVKDIGGTKLYYVKLLEGSTEQEKRGIMFESIGGCYKVINITTVGK